MNGWRADRDQVRAALSAEGCDSPGATDDELWAMGYETDRESARRAQAEITAREEILLARLTRVE